MIKKVEPKDLNAGDVIEVYFKNRSSDFLINYIAEVIDLEYDSNVTYRQIQIRTPSGRIREGKIRVKILEVISTYEYTLKEDCWWFPDERLELRKIFAEKIFAEKFNFLETLK